MSGVVKFVVLGVMMVAFGVAFYVQFKLHKYVSRDKLLEVEDVTKLWEHSIPPREILTEDGLRLYRYFTTCFRIFVGCAILLAVVASFG